MKIFKIITLSISLIFILSCDDIEEPFVQETNSECGDASLPIPIRQVLIEEFTGHKCGYCPRGDEEVEFLKELYCDHVIPVSIHTGIFAEVNSSDKYSYDYRTEDGAAISEYFGPTEFPSAVINRDTYNGSLVLGETYWLTAVTDILEQKPVVDLEINTTYTSGSRNLEVKVDLIFLEAMNAELMLSVYFVEDSIISWQKDYSLEVGEQDVEFYVHNHVLRDAINGTWGDAILTGQAEANMVKSKSYQYSINPEWKVKNSSIVAFVYKNDTKEVLQASQEHIIQ